MPLSPEVIALRREEQLYKARLATGDVSGAEKAAHDAAKAERKRDAQRRYVEKHSETVKETHRKRNKAYYESHKDEVNVARKEAYETKSELKQGIKQAALERYHALSPEEKEARKARQRELYALRKQESLQTLVAGGHLLAPLGAGAGAEIAPPVKRRPRKERTPEEEAARTEAKKEAVARHLEKMRTEDPGRLKALQKERRLKHLAKETPEQKEARLAKARETHLAKKKAGLESK